MGIFINVLAAIGIIIGLVILVLLLAVIITSVLFPFLGLVADVLENKSERIVEKLKRRFI